MNKEIEVKWLKEKSNHKPGDLIKTSEEMAKHLVEKGDAEYIEKPKEWKEEKYGRFINKDEIIIEDISEEDILMVAGKMEKAGYTLEYWKAPKQTKGGHLHIKNIKLPEDATIKILNKYKELTIKKYVNENLWEKVDWNFYQRKEDAEPHRIVTENTKHYKGYGIKTLIRTWGDKKENPFEEKIWDKAVEEFAKEKFPEQNVEDWNSFIDKVIPNWIEGKRQELSLSVGGYLRKDKRLGIEKVKSIITEICKKAKDNEIPMRLKGVDETFKKDEKDIKGYSGLKFLKEEIKQKKTGVGKNLFTRRGQIEDFWEEQPFFYDKSKIFWIWDLKDKKWIRSDEVDFLNAIQKMQGVETLNSKIKAELVEGFKQIGRQHLPKPIKKEWVQFLDKIYNVQTEETFEATPEYFVTNPIPWKIGESEDTPTIDKLFAEWVGEKDKKSLYEFIAYNISLDKFMQRIFAFCGGGSNGKGTFIKLNYKFLGEDNCVSSEIKALSEDKFEPAVLYRKLLCVMGEVSYGDLRNTNQLKKLAGEDKISFQFKGKTPFTDENTATCVCLTNSLPATPDKSLGFYRKWKIEDFPNQFKEISKDLIKEIPEVEFENLARKSLRILKELYKHRKFNNEGDFKERIKKYEERSNPVMKFIEENYDEIAGENVLLRDFTNDCNKYLIKKHLRQLNAIQVGKILRNEGFTVGARKIGDISAVAILNLKAKTITTIQTIKNPTNLPYRTSSSNLDSSNSSNSSQRKLKENDVKIKSIVSSTCMVLKDGEPFNLTLEKNRIYKKEDFGDNAEQTIEILKEDGKVVEV